MPPSHDPTNVDADSGELLAVLTGKNAAVLAADAGGLVTSQNLLSETLTGWTEAASQGVELKSVFHLVDEEFHQPVEGPLRALREGRVVDLAHALLVAKDGAEHAIRGSATPFSNADGTGIVLVYSELAPRSPQPPRSPALAVDLHDILSTLREPFLVLDSALRVRLANAAFCRTFGVTSAETADCPLFELSGGQWDIPWLRQALETALAGRPVRPFEMEHTFARQGRLRLRLDVRPIQSQPVENGSSDATGPGGAKLLLLSIDDVTNHRQLEAVERQDEAAWRSSEVQYRRLFESARDGILILDLTSGKIIDVNPFMSELLGYPLTYFLGKEPWEIGLFEDIAANRAAIQTLQTEGYLRYEHLPLETRDHRRVEVEVVSNAYEAGGRMVIQCNIRDCSERFRLEQAVRASLEEKEVLLKEVHHRVKNNLQVICSLLHLQSLYTPDPMCVQMFQEIQNRVRSMALIHERLYRSQDLTHVDFTGYIENLASHLFSAQQVDAERIELVVDVQGVQLAIDAAIPCGLLLNELISNCLKHAFVGRERGQIRIELRPLPRNEILLSVSDDGVGLPASVQPDAGETFGMQLIADLVLQLRGRVQITRTAGTRFEVVFARSEPLSTPQRIPS